MSLKLFFCGLMLAGTFSLSAQHKDDQVLIETKSLQSAAIRSVQAETDNGNISVTGVNDNEARVEVYAWLGESSDQEVKRRFAEEYDLKMNTDDNKLTISCKVKNRHRNSRLSVTFRLYVPVASSTELRTSGGNMHAMKLSGGKHKLVTSGGNMAFDDIKGEVSGTTSGGNISISGCSESIKVSTSGGNISARESDGTVTLSTSGGNVSLEDLSGDTKAQTSGGNMSASNITGELTISSSGGNLELTKMSCALDASTAGGHLAVDMRKLDKYVKLRNGGSGSTRLQLPDNAAVDLSATGHSVKVDHSGDFTGDMNDHHVKGKLGGGGLPVTIDGGDSRVVVTAK